MDGGSVENAGAIFDQSILGHKKTPGLHSGNTKRFN